MEESQESRKDIEIVKEVIVQNSKQLFVIIPKDLERLLHIKEGNKIKFIVKIPAKKSDKIQIKLEVNDERREYKYLDKYEREIIIFRFSWNRCFN